MCAMWEKVRAVGWIIDQLQYVRIYTKSTITKVKKKTKWTATTTRENKMKSNNSIDNDFFSNNQCTCYVEKGN